MERERGAHCSALSSAYSALELTEALAPLFSLFTNISCVLLPLCFPVTFLPATSSHQALSEHPSAQTKSMLELRGDRGQGKYLWGLCGNGPWDAGSLLGLSRVSKGAKEALSVHKDGQELP